MIAVINASPLISLALINQLNIIREVFSEVYVPSQVYHEVLGNETERPGSEVLKAANWLKVVRVSNQITVDILSYSLDPGEAEVLALAYQLKPDFVIIDELKGRKMANYLGIDVIGTLGLLLMSKELKIIAEVKPLMQQLKKKGIWISNKLYDEVLRLAQETD